MPSVLMTIAGNLGNVSLGDRRDVRIMGVINLNENSFYPGSVAKSDEAVQRMARILVKDGTDFIDVGARSTAPYRTSEVSTETESRLLVRAVKIISKTTDVPISVDTTRYEPARQAVAEGATILNDVFGFTQKDARKLANLVASRNLSLLLSAHERKSTLHSNPVETVISCLESSLEFAEIQGIDRKRIAIDPGIGFFSDPKISNVEWNLSVIANLRKLRKFGRPICVGLSRKRFIGKILGRDLPSDRLYGSLGASAVAVYNGAHLVRTHDVMQTREVAKLALAIREKGLSHQNL
jgi:dihydropteroate synthase